MQKHGNFQPVRRLGKRICDITARADDKVGPGERQDFFHLVCGGQGKQYRPDIGRGERPAQSFHLYRIKGIPFLLDQAVFHSVLSADKGDIGTPVRMTKHACHGKRGVDVAGTAATGKKEGHVFLLSAYRLM